MGVLGGDWVDERNVDDTSYELHTDIDVTFTMTGLTDTGLTFGASIDLDESDGVTSSNPDDTRGESLAFDGRTQGGEEIFISGAFGTLTMGDTDGALDWALQEIGIGGTLGDAHTTHAGYNGNDFADSGDDDGDGQIARYDHSFGDFAVALSVNISDDSSHEDVFAAGAKYNASLAAMELGLGVGYSQLGNEREEDDAMGVSLDADFNNGFRAILNWVDMGDNNNLDNRSFSEQYIGVGLGYTVDDWTFAANWGEYSEEYDFSSSLKANRRSSGYALVVNYDMGGGAEVQLGYTKADCLQQTIDGTLWFDHVFNHDDCFAGSLGDSRMSFGVAMSF